MCLPARQTQDTAAKKRPASHTKLPASAWPLVKAEGLLCLPVK